MLSQLLMILVFLSFAPCHFGAANGQSKFTDLFKEDQFDLQTQQLAADPDFAECLPVRIAGIHNARFREEDIAEFNRIHGLFFSRLKRRRSATKAELDAAVVPGLRRVLSVDRDTFILRATMGSKSIYYFYQLSRLTILLASNGKIAGRAKLPDEASTSHSLNPFIMHRDLTKLLLNLDIGGYGIQGCELHDALILKSIGCIHSTVNLFEPMGEGTDDGECHVVDVFKLDRGRFTYLSIKIDLRQHLILIDHNSGIRADFTTNNLICDIKRMKVDVLAPCLSSERPKALSLTLTLLAALYYLLVQLELGS